MTDRYTMRHFPPVITFLFTSCTKFIIEIIFPRRAHTQDELTHSHPWYWPLDRPVPWKREVIKCKLGSKWRAAPQLRTLMCNQFAPVLLWFKCTRIKKHYMINPCMLLQNQNSLFSYITCFSIAEMSQTSKQCELWGLTECKRELAMQTTCFHIAIDYRRHEPGCADRCFSQVWVC